MSLCECKDRPRCESPACEFYASWTVLQPQWGERPKRATFMCDEHYKMYHAFMTKPVRGLDPMVPNDEYFRPSLREVIRHGMIAVAFEEREYIEDGSLLQWMDKRFTKAQLPQVLWLRRALRR